MATLYSSYVENVLWQLIQKYKHHEPIIYGIKHQGVDFIATVDVRATS